MRRPARAIACFAAVVAVGFTDWLATASPAKQSNFTPSHPALPVRVRRTGVAMMRAEKEGSSKDEARVAYMESPFGQALGVVAQALSSGPLNDAKIAFAKFQAGEYDEAAVKAKLEKYIEENPTVVFSFSKCPFCIKAKKELTEMGADYTAVELDQLGDEGNQLRAELAKRTSRTSMPNIFIGGEGVGGCNDGPGLLTLKKEGKLEPMLKKVGSLK
mmetsp:Transcript_10728/g.15139  ORF Transcript_10728/g.15139 Transcript_10728/m.15139 type:complete len:216 (-) Transcript_10728:38-685(-)